MKSLILETRIKLTFKTLPAQNDGPQGVWCSCAVGGGLEKPLSSLWCQCPALALLQ